MKRGGFLLYFILCLFALAGMAYPATIMSDIDEMSDAVREETGLHNTSVLPDSTLWDVCHRNVILVSVTVGGVESQVRIVTVQGQGFYAMPDSVTRILFATLITNTNATKELRAWYPQFGVEPDALEAGDEDNVPGQYNWWNDTVQFMPKPQNSNDTAIFKVYVEHSDYPDSTADDVPIDLEFSYKQLAFYLSCYEALLIGDMAEKAAIYEAKYYKEKDAIMQTYARQFEQNYPNKDQ